jgi:hypothetical protein
MNKNYECLHDFVSQSEKLDHMMAPMVGEVLQLIYLNKYGTTFVKILN